MNTERKISELEIVDHFSRLIHCAAAAVNAAEELAELDDDRGARWRDSYEDLGTAHRMAAICEVRDLLTAIGAGDVKAVALSEAENGNAFVRAARTAGESFGLLES